MTRLIFKYFAKDARRLLPAVSFAVAVALFPADPAKAFDDVDIDIDYDDGGGDVYIDDSINIYDDGGVGFVGGLAVGSAISRSYRRRPVVVKRRRARRPAQKRRRAQPQRRAVQKKKKKK